MDVAVHGLELRGVSVRTVMAPLDPPVQTSSAHLPHAPLVLLDLLTGQGITGRSYLFCYTPLVLAPLARLVQEIGEALVGTALVPATVQAALEARFRLLRPHRGRRVHPLQGQSRVGRGRHRRRGGPRDQVCGGRARAGRGRLQPVP